MIIALQRVSHKPYYYRIDPSKYECIVVCKEILKHSELTVVHENQPYLSTFKGCRVNKWHKIETKYVQSVIMKCSNGIRINRKAKRPFRELLSDPTDDEYQYDLSTEFPSL